MLELGVGADIVRGIGLLFWIAFAIALGIALWKPKTKPKKAAWAAGVVLVFLGPILPSVYQQYDFKQRQAKAMALFQERCKTAGEKISTTVQNVEVIVWMKWRPTGVNLGDQFKLDDPYGKNCAMEGCIRLLLRPSGSEQFPAVAARYARGFQFVETEDPKDGKLYRYAAAIRRLEGHEDEFRRSVEATGYGAEPEGVYIALERQPIAAYTAKYGVEWEDISTREDREQWVAGGKIRVVDLASGSTVGERTGFLFDQGLGSTAGFRSPWAWAGTHGPACPPVSGHNEAFIYNVLRPGRN